MEPYVTPESLETKARLWIEKVAPFNQHQMRLGREKSALSVTIISRLFIAAGIIGIAYHSTEMSGRR